jgi:hypothetical protein
MPNKITQADIEQLIGVLDQALQSDTPAVISALQNLVLVTSLSESGDARGIGPIRQLQNRIDRLETVIERLERDLRVVLSETSTQRRVQDEYLKYRYDYNSNPSWTVSDYFPSKYYNTGSK